MVLATQLVPIAILKVRIKPATKRVLFDPAVFKDPPFTLFTVSFFFALIGLYIPTFYVQDYALAKNLTSAEFSAYILPILNAAGIAGRIIPNFFADRTGPLNMLVPCLFGAAILTFAWLGVHNEGGIIAFALIYGFFSGTILSLPPMVIVSLSPRLEVLATRMGMSLSVVSLGLLVGTPVSGAILNDTNSFVGLQAFGGAILMTGAVLTLVTRIVKVGVGIAKI